MKHFCPVKTYSFVEESKEALVTIDAASEPLPMNSSMMKRILGSYYISSDGRHRTWLGETERRHPLHRA